MVSIRQTERDQQREKSDYQHLEMGTLDPPARNWTTGNIRFAGHEDFMYI